MNEEVESDDRELRDQYKAIRTTIQGNHTMNNHRIYDRILVEMSSPYSEAALKQAVWIARQTGSQIVLAVTGFSI